MDGHSKNPIFSGGVVKKSWSWWVDGERKEEQREGPLNVSGGSATRKKRHCGRENPG